MDGGDAVDTIVKREEDYFAPVCAHFGFNNVPKEYKKLAMLYMNVHYVIIQKFNILMN